MREEHELVGQVRAAQNNSAAADALIQQYLPFIKSETAKFLKHPVQEGEDEELGIAMLAFYESILAYQRGKGAFLRLAATAIRNRLIDYYRREQRHIGVLSLDQPVGGEEEQTILDQLDSGQDEWTEGAERSATKEEIAEFSHQLAAFGLTLSDIADNCPKQERTQTACLLALDYAKQHPDLLDQLVRNKKLPLAALTLGSGVERKTLERHRSYLVAILLAYTNGFEIIRGHLCQIKRKEVERA